MVTYRCSWCGSRAEDEPERLVSCARCARECLRLLGFWPNTVMVPLAPGEEPPEPVAAGKRFRWVDARTGELRGMTEVPAGHDVAQRGTA